MSYAPPSGNAVDFTFESGYTAPLGSAVAFDFGDGPPSEFSDITGAITASATVSGVGQTLVDVFGVISAQSTFNPVGATLKNADASITISATLLGTIEQVPFPEFQWLGPRVKLRSPVIRAISTSRDERGVIKVAE
jgi:hypothetical protein